MAISPEERKLLEFLDRIDGEAESTRQQAQFEQKADTWIQYRAGEAWGTKGESPIFTANVLGNLIERKIATLTQSQPDIRVSARNPLYSSSARVLTDTIAAILAEQGFDARIETAADFAATFGHVIFNTAWNPNADHGTGNVVIEVLDPRKVFIDPHCKDVTRLHEAQYVRIDRPMPCDDIKRIWPGRGAEVKPDSKLSMMPGLMRSPAFGTPGKRPINAPDLVDGPYQWATVREYWVQSNQPAADGVSLAYPAGRVIHRAGDVVLDDMPNPYWDGAYPIDVWDWRVNADALTGRSDVQEVLRLQESMNRLGNAIVKNVLLNNAITIIGDYNALQPEDWKKLDSRAARIIKKMPGREVTIVPPPPIPEQYLRLLDLMSRLMETILGVPEAMQGRRQAGVIASSAVEGLQTAAETLIRSTARRLEYTIERIGHKLISRVIQFYASDRVMLIQGPGKEWQEYTFRRAELMKPLAEGIDPATGQPLSPEERESKMREFFTQFRFKVTPLSSMPQNRIQRGLMALQLMQAGLVDGEEVMKVVEWPDWKAVLERVGQKQATGQMPIPGMEELTGGKAGGEPPRPNRAGTALKMG